jgi:hypothetical protein
MRNFDEVAKGLGGFVNLWITMANKDISRKFRRWNEPLSYYWRAVRSTMATQIFVIETLQNGFWPSSRFVLLLRMNLWMTAEFVKNTLKMLHLWDIGTIVHHHHFVLVAMYLLDTLLWCILQMAICTHSGLLGQSPI